MDADGSERVSVQHNQFLKFYTSHAFFTQVHLRARRGRQQGEFSLEFVAQRIFDRSPCFHQGPILAIATAASSLLERRTLDVDLVMIIEGEEEAGSHGFANAVRTHKESIGEIDCILVSNSSWIGEDSPCITYGLRGVVHMQIEVGWLSLPFNTRSIT